MRSGRVTSIKAEVVFSNDSFTYSFGLSETLEHVPADGERGRPTHAYAYALLKDGGHAFEVMTVAEVERIRGRSRAGQSGPWVSDWEMMARKTAIRRLAKLLPLSSEFRDASERDTGDDHLGEIDLPAGDHPPTIDTTATTEHPVQSEQKSNPFAEGNQ
jgi:recombination protein RecT